jgi:hypothetical protein
MAALTYGLIEAGERGWTDALILASFAVATVVGALFVWVESRTARPMVPLRFFRSSTFTGANLDAFAISFLIAGIAFFGTLYQQNVHGFGPVRAGMTLIPMVIVMMVASPISGVLINRLGSAMLISLGMAIAGLGTLLFLRADVGASYYDLLPSYLVLGLGMSLIFAPMTTAVLNSVESEKSGVASAVNGAIREIGNAFGVAFLGTLMNRAYQARFDASPEVAALRADPESASLGPVVDTIGSGMSYGGRVVERFPGLEEAGAVVAQLRTASSDAFIAGMDRAIYASAATIIAVACVSFVLIRDRRAAPVAQRGKVGEAVRGLAAD